MNKTQPNSVPAAFSLGDKIAGGLIVAGIFLRIVPYARNCSLGGDEPAIATAICNRTWTETLQGIPHEFIDDWHARPLFFTITEKLLLILGGTEEFVLRLLPFLAGIISLLVFDRLLKQTFTTTTRLTALGFLAFSPTAIYYAVEMKPYSSDILLALVVLMLSVKFFQQPRQPKDILRLGLLGAIFPWCSYTSLFLLTTAWGTILLAYFRNRRNLFSLLLVGSLWIVNVQAIHVFAMRHAFSLQFLTDYWDKAFLPWPPSLTTLFWLTKALPDLWIYNSGFPNTLFFSILTGGLFLLGLFRLWKNHRIMILLLIGPILATLAASALKKYPFDGRLILFLAPAVFILLGEGLSFLITPQTTKRKILCLGLAGILFFPLITKSILNTRQPCPAQNREAFQFVKRHVNPDDRLFFNANGLSALGYYAGQTGLADRWKKTLSAQTAAGQTDYYPGIDAVYFTDPIAKIAGRPTVTALPSQLIFDTQGNLRTVTEEPALRISCFSQECLSRWGQGRSWLVLAGHRPELQKLLLEIFNQCGRQLKKFEGREASVYLYDLTCGGHNKEE